MEVFVKIYNGWEVYRCANGQYRIQPKHMNAEFDSTKRFKSMGEVKRFINAYK